jgi:hypothetical protein
MPQPLQYVLGLNMEIINNNNNNNRQYSSTNIIGAR